MLKWNNNEVVEVGKFQQYVKPSVCPIVSPFCEKLTGITQEMVNKGASLEETIAKHLKWINDVVSSNVNEIEKKNDIKNKVMIVTCGAWDIEIMLPTDLGRNEIDTDPIYEQYVNLKDLFKTVTGIRSSKASMFEMLKYYDLELEGRHHSGLDDSRNIARIISEMIKRGLTMEMFVDHVKK